MSFLKQIYDDILGYEKMTDDELLNDLANAVGPDNSLFQTHLGVTAMLSVIHDRVTKNKVAHAALVPVANCMAALENRPHGYRHAEKFAALREVLAGRCEDDSSIGFMLPKPWMVSENS